MEFFDLRLKVDTVDSCHTFGNKFRPHSRIGGKHTLLDQLFGRACHTGLYAEYLIFLFVTTDPHFRQGEFDELSC